MKNELLILYSLVCPKNIIQFKVIKLKIWRFKISK